MEAADEAIGAVDQVALAQFVAQKSPEEGPTGGKRKEMGEMKEGLTDALHKKCKALLLQLKTHQVERLVRDCFRTRVQ